MKPVTGLTILGSAFGGAKLIRKLLGPTVEYIGDGVQNWPERRVENVASIFSNAKEKLGHRIESPGAVPPRVLKEILSEGSFCDNPITIDYFGGVLASSRSQVIRDDRGAAWAALVTRLSSYQIRSHFLAYWAIADHFRGLDFKVNMEDQSQLKVLLPFSSYFVSMEHNSDEKKQFYALLNHSFFGLAKEGLIEDFVYGNSDTLKEHNKIDFQIPEEGGIYITPSPLGIELFFWAYGLGNASPPSLLQLAFKLPHGMTPCAAMSRDALRTQKTKYSDTSNPQESTDPQI